MDRVRDTVRDTVPGPRWRCYHHHCQRVFWHGRDLARHLLDIHGGQ
jgi:hypothetical protein